MKMIAEIVGHNGHVRYRRSVGDPLVAEARKTPGYSVRIVPENTHALPHGFRWREAKGDAVHRKLRRSVCVPTRRYLWVPADEIEFVPALSSRIYGDGRALIHLATIDDRPAFYVVRIDSTWQIGTDMDATDGAPEFVEFLDEIQDGLEDEFGRGDRDEEDGEDWEPKWPAYRSGGCAWARVDWPKLRSLRFERHPHTWRGNLLVIP